MGLFKKKSDPISERAQALSAEIAALEAQIKKLSAQETKPDHQETQVPAPASRSTPLSAPTPPPASSAQPRLRSTALPHHRQSAVVQPAAPVPARGPVFEEVDHNRLQSEPDTAASEPSNELDVRKNDFPSLWRRLTMHFRGPPTSNPKLVNYLAAGSIQGLRPLRYERRVARNRFLVLVICLVLVLWGLIAIFVRHR